MQRFVFAIGVLVASFAYANAFFLPVLPPFPGIGPSCGDGLDGSLDFSPARLIRCVAEKAKIPLASLRHTQTAYERIYGLAGPVFDPEDTDSFTSQGSFFIATNEAWVEAARVLRVPVLSLVTGAFPSSLEALEDILAFNTAADSSFVTLDSDVANPVTYKMNTGFISRISSGHSLTATGRETPAAAKFTTVLSETEPSTSSVDVIVDDWRPDFRSFRFRASAKNGIPSVPVCWADTKVVVPNIFLCSGNLGGFVYNPVTQAWDLFDPIVPDCPVVHVTNRLLLPTTCNVFPTVEEIVCLEPNLALYCLAFQLVKDELALEDLVETTFLAPTNFAFTQAFIALGIFTPLIVNNVDYISEDNFPIIEKIIAYNTLDAPLPSCVSSLPSPTNYNSLATFSNTTTPLEVTFERRSALERLCGGSLFGEYLFERVVFIGQVNSATALIRGIDACKENYIYITDAVLLPPDLFSTRTVYDIVQFKASLPGNQYDLFASLVERSDLLPDYQGITSGGTFLDGITVFIPTTRGIKDAIRYLKITDTPFDLAGDLPNLPSSLVNDIVEYHTVKGTYFISNLLVLDLSNLDTFLPDGDDQEQLEIVVLGTYPTQFIKLVGVGGCSEANVINVLSDQRAVNGIVHCLDGALIPPSYCRSSCSLIEINPLTNVFIAILYAIGLEKDFCTEDCFTGEDSGEDATWLVPTDIAFTAVFAYLGLPQNTIFEFPALLYDIITYHIVAGVSALSTGLVTGTVVFPILSRYTEENDQYPELEFIRVDTEDLQGWHFTTLYVQGQEFENPPARVIIPDQKATDGVVHTINRVLLPSTDRTCKEPELVYVDGDCSDIPCTITGLFPSTSILSIEALVTYVPDPTCIPWCLSWWCFPCTPLSAQPIVTLGGINGSFAASFLDDPLGVFLNVLNRGNALGALSLYVNQVGELRLGVAPYFDELLFEEKQILDVTNAPSIYASGVTFFPFQTYKILTTYSEACALAKIYVNDIIRAVAVIDFALPFEEEFVIIGGSNPLINVKQGVAPNIAADATAQFNNLGPPYPDNLIPTLYNPYLSLVTGFGPDGIFAEDSATFQYGAGFVSSLIDGEVGWIRASTDPSPIPAYLEESAYFKDCVNPKYHQCATDSPKDACCGLSARDYKEWLGLIEYVYLSSIIIYPSACTYPNFLPTAQPGPIIDFPEVDIPEEIVIVPVETPAGEAPGEEVVIIQPDVPFDDPNNNLQQNPLSGGGVLNPFEP